MSLQKNSVLEDHQLKHQHLMFEVAVVSSATPASKKQSSDLSGVCALSSEGKDEITAIEDLSMLSGFSADVDNSTGDSVVHLLLKGSELGSIAKVMKVSVSEKTALAASVAVSKLGGDFKTAGGNIAMQIAGTGLNLASESPTLIVEVDYMLSK